MALAWGMTVSPATPRDYGRRGDPARIEGVIDPSDPDQDLHVTGPLLPGPNATLAGPTFTEWLDSPDAWEATWISQQLRGTARRVA